MNHHLLLVIHLICAAIWVGGHLFLAVRILPLVLKENDVGQLLSFEKKYEPVGMPALLLLVITGIWMALQYGVPVRQWFSFASPIERVVSTKLALLLFTVLLALSAQIRVLPRLRAGAARLPEMALHIVGVTAAGVAMLVLGTFVRYGGL